MSRARTRSQRQVTKPPTLNLVSLMDIFTILVFFLMVNANDVEVLETTSAIKLPDSMAEEKPEQRVSIEVNADDLLLQGKSIASVEALMAEDKQQIDALVAGLTREAMLQREQLTDPESFEGKVTIMGDKALPYALLKRVMLSCQTAAFTQIALAVNQVGEKEAAS